MEKESFFCAKKNQEFGISLEVGLMNERILEIDSSEKFRKKCDLMSLNPKINHVIF